MLYTWVTSFSQLASSVEHQFLLSCSSNSTSDRLNSCKPGSWNDTYWHRSRYISGYMLQCSGENPFFPNALYVLPMSATKNMHARVVSSYCVELWHWLNIWNMFPGCWRMVAQWLWDGVNLEVKFHCISAQFYLLSVLVLKYFVLLTVKFNYFHAFRRSWSTVSSIIQLN